MGVLGNHLSVETFANQLGTSVDELVGRCVNMGVPILHGQVDKTLFFAVEKELEGEAASGENT